MKDFSNAIKIGRPAEYLQDIQKQIEDSIKQMQSAIVQGRRITDWPEYKTHLPIFSELNKHSIDCNKLITAINFTSEDMRKYLDQIMITGELNIPGLLTDLQNKTLTAGPNCFDNILSYRKEDINSILRTLKIHDNIMNQVPDISSPTLKRYTLEHLYKDSVELYLKVLRELYTKVQGKKPKSNTEIYDFFKKHPPLWETSYNKMRADTSHRLFTVYDTYTDDDLHCQANSILVKALTGIIAKNMYLADFYKQAMSDVVKGLPDFNKTVANTL